MAEYCNEIDVENRLKEAGYVNLADDDDDGTVSPGEVAANITSAIQAAGTDMDEYFANRNPPYGLTALRASGNQWCLFCCRDIAAWYVCSNGGGDVPTPIQSAYDRRMARLEAIEAGNIVPGAPIDQPYNADYNTPFVIESLEF
jgi:phage gp36-like protein